MATATVTMAERASGTGFRYLSDAQVKANSPYGLPIIEDVRQFNLGGDSFFSGLSQSTLEELNRVTFPFRHIRGLPTFPFPPKSGSQVGERSDAFPPWLR